MAAWQPLAPDDVEAVLRIADVVHSELPEGEHVFAERIRLFPEGCLALVKQGNGNADRELCGYAISHPIRRHQPPALDAVLGAIPPDASQYYIHDFCVLPEFRGQGLAGQGIRRLLSVASANPERFPDGACLVSVYGTVPFWVRYGFSPPEPAIDAALAEKVRGYGEDAQYLERPTASP
ncbi:acyl-CoA N-acyltransferase [Apiospora aurea]|uniref:Acyl-CoA N-acyltransferase n=1 Tax=Apiospora aurea TaxID=335848 RepID=A0ABR1Q0H3_9PEZI